MLRKIKRNMARVNMKKAGYVRINKGKAKGVNSFFSEHWRQFVKKKKRYA